MFMQCEVCKGTTGKPASVVQGKSVADVLDMTVEEARNSL